VVSVGALTDAEVVDKLRAGWKASNDANRVVWDKHVQRDRDAAEAIRQTQE
jgi:hypothetical protein